MIMPFQARHYLVEMAELLQLHGGYRLVGGEVLAKEGAFPELRIFEMLPMGTVVAVGPQHIPVLRIAYNHETAFASREYLGMVEAEGARVPDGARGASVRMPATHRLSGV